MKKGKGWSQEDIEEMLYLRNEEGLSVKEVSELINRSYKSVEQKLFKLRNGLVQIDSECDEDFYGDYTFRKKKTYIFSTITAGAKVDDKFLAALELYAKKKSGDVVLIPSDKNASGDLIPDKYKKYIPKEGQLPYKVNNNLFVSDQRTNINLVDPLSGMDSLVSLTGCMIVAGSRHRAKMVPRMLKQNHAPRAMWCTGSINESYYKSTKTAKNIKPFHTIGAVIVEVINKEIFFVRQLTWDGKQFYDLDNVCSASSIKKSKRLKLLNMGDDHVCGLNPKVKNATKELIKKLNPEIIIHHDTLDCVSISHHVAHKHLTKSLINMSLEEEGKLTAKYIDEMTSCSKAKHYLVASNHPEHLDRYLDEFRFKEDPRNLILALKLTIKKAEGNSAVESLLKMFSKLERFKVLSRKDSMIIGGIEQANHGDEGSNGARGSAKGVGLSHGGKVTSGHTHQAEIGVYNNYVNGTMTYLSLDYTGDSGASSWVNAHTLQYPNGSRSQYFIMPDGKHILGK